LLRLTELYDAHAVYVPRGLLTSVEEVADTYGQHLLTETIVPFPGSPASGSGAGIYPSRLGILLQFDSSAVLFCESITADQIQFVNNLDIPSVCLCGRLGNRNSLADLLPDWSETEQPGGCVVVLMSPGASAPAAVYNLSASGGVRLLFSTSGDAAPTVDLWR
ncbi:MAG: hypothetical protein AB1744_01970, partial [Candidatus Zixiibacteriota bacterium]